MKRKLLIALGIIVVILIGGWYAVTDQVVKMVTNFEPFTLEKVFNDQELIEVYGIGDAKGPADYGYTKFELVDFPSFKDGLMLKGWYVPSADSSDKTIIMVHGRTSNRLKTMKYLELFKDTGLDTLYNVFIPDLRNSGESPVASTYMGYKFAEDVAGAVQYLKNKRDQKKFVLYGFSMGAMAIAASLDREELDLTVYELDRIILDSPLTNAKENLRERSVGLGLPNFVFEKVYDQFSEEINGYGEKLRLSMTIDNVPTPILIIHSKDDTSTPLKYTEEELSQLPKSMSIKTWFMDGPKHVGIYQSDKWHDEYTKRVADFIRY